MSAALQRFVAVSASALALLVLHCSSGGSGSVTATDGGPNGCPANPPAVGTACSLPSSTTCSAYPAPGCMCCAGSSYVCQGGKWVELKSEARPGPPQSCPATPPKDGDSCASGPCSAAPSSCPYGCESGGPATASCVGGKWSVAYTNVMCMDSGTDAALPSDAGDAG